jgi:glyoxylase-like metal-dependent hydrolase (beta-lactamase superfamily II)
MTKEVYLVPNMSSDSRVLVFRRDFTPPVKEDMLQVDAYVIITERYVVLCDTLLCPEDMAIVLNEITPTLARRQLLVVNSHSDWDHTWGNRYFVEHGKPPIIAHSLCPQGLFSDESRETLAYFQGHYDTFKDVELIPPTLTFEQRLTIYGGDLTLELFSAPGHEPDQLAGWIPELRLLLAFDAAEYPIPTLHKATGVPSMIKTLEHFLTLHPARVFCSHGGTSEISVIEQNLMYLHTIEQRVQALLTTQAASTEETLLAAALREYPFEEVLSTLAPLFQDDSSFYREAHTSNVRYMVQWWLLSQLQALNEKE